MKLSEFREWTKDYPEDAEIVIAGGYAMVKEIESGGLYPSDFNPRCAKAVSIADTRDAVVLEL